MTPAPETTPSVERFNLIASGVAMMPHESGYWVRHDDHIAALARLSERVAELEKAIIDFATSEMSINALNSWADEIEAGTYSGTPITRLYAAARRRALPPERAAGAEP